MLQTLQMGYAANEPTLHNRAVLPSDLERAIDWLGEAPTKAFADNIYEMVMEYVRSFSGNGKMKLFWTKSKNDWPDVINGPLRDLTLAISEHTPHLQWIYVLSLRMRLLNDVLAEERVTGKISTTGSFHHALLTTVSNSDWRGFVSKAFKVMAPMDWSKTTEEGKSEWASTKRRKRKEPAKKASAAQSSAEAASPSKMEVDPVLGDEWIPLRMELAPDVYDIRVCLLELLENLYVLLAPGNPNFSEPIVDGFCSFTTDAERFFFINKFVATPSTRLPLLDHLLMSIFVRNTSTLQKKANLVTEAPSTKKLMTVYWDLRPAQMIKRPEGMSPKSNYALLATLLLHILDSLEFPNHFSDEDIRKCAEKAKLLHSEAKSVGKRESVYTTDEIELGIEHTQDLMNFVSAFVPQS
jgi:hypothetical protein